MDAFVISIDRGNHSWMSLLFLSSGEITRGCVCYFYRQGKSLVDAFVISIVRGNHLWMRLLFLSSGEITCGCVCYFYRHSEWNLLLRIFFEHKILIAVLLNYNRIILYIDWQ